MSLREEVRRVRYKITRTYIVEADDPIAARIKFSEAVQNGTEDTYFESVFFRELSEPKPAGWTATIKSQLLSRPKR